MPSDHIHASSNVESYARLIRAANEPVNRRTEAYRKTVHEIRTDHIAQSDAYIATTKIRQTVHAQINEECSKLTRLLGAIEEISEVSAKTLDIIIGKGELLACYVMSSILEDQNVVVYCVDLSDVIVGDVEDPLLYRKATDAFVKKIYDCGDRVPV